MCDDSIIMFHSFICWFTKEYIYSTKYEFHIIWFSAPSLSFRTSTISNQYTDCFDILHNGKLLSNIMVDNSKKSWEAVLCECYGPWLYWAFIDIKGVLLLCMYRCGKCCVWGAHFAWLFHVWAIAHWSNIQTSSFWYIALSWHTVWDNRSVSCIQYEFMIGMLWSMGKGCCYHL